MKHLEHLKGTWDLINDTWFLPMDKMNDMLRRSKENNHTKLVENVLKQLN